MAREHTEHEPHIGTFIDQSVSQLAQFSGLILTITVVIIFLFRQYVLEPFLVTKLYGPKYSTLSETNQRSFINHHIACIIKIVLLTAGAYPVVDIVFGTGHLHTPFAGSRTVTLGDVMLVCSDIFTAMYIFELFYRKTISPISSAHHIGAIVIAQSAIAISLNYSHDVDAVFEFSLCLIWGAFDVFAELLPHIAMIIYRAFPNNHLLLEKVFLGTCVLEVISTTLETAVVMWLFGSLWDRWTLPFKVVTPMLHVLFSIAQLWGAWIFYQLWQRERQRVLQQSTGFISTIEALTGERFNQK